MLSALLKFGIGHIADVTTRMKAWMEEHEYESIENGIKLRSTFRLPAKVPKPFIETLRKHNKEEIGEFVNFLPRLFEENKNST